MKRKLIVLALGILLTNFAQATKVITADDSDWDNPSSWVGNKIPARPDTILIKHYFKR